MGRRTLLLFDFDGTLADSRPHLIHLFNRLARRHGFLSIDESDPNLRDLSMRQLLQRLGISIARVPALLREVRDEMRAVMPQIRPFEGIVDTLYRLDEQGVALGLVTSNERNNFQYFAEKYRLPQFGIVVAGSTLFGKSRVIRNVVGRFEKGSMVYYVGDESRDIEAAQKATVGTIAVSWGFNSRAHLA